MSTELDSVREQLHHAEVQLGDEPARVASAVAAMRERCIRVAEDQARQLEEMGDHDAAGCVRTVVTRIRALL